MRVVSSLPRSSCLSRQASICDSPAHTAWTIRELGTHRDRVFKEASQELIVSRLAFAEYHPKTLHPHSALVGCKEPRSLARADQRRPNERGLGKRRGPVGRLQLEYRVGMVARAPQARACELAHREVRPLAIVVSEFRAVAGV